MANELKDVKRPQRWDVPFWKEPLPGEPSREMTEADADAILKLAPFRDIDGSKFPPSTPYRGILLNDARIRHYRKGDIVVRQGDYGNSAFFVVSGSVRVILEGFDERLIGRRAPQRKSFLTALAQLWTNPGYPEVRQRTSAVAGGPLTISSSAGSKAIFVQDVSAILQEKKTARMPAGELFGEIAALGRVPRSNTVVADEDCELLELRWQGLREVRRYSPALKEHIDRLYRERNLLIHLRETPMFRQLSEANLNEVAAATEFQTYGTFDWHTSYKKITEMSPAERLQYEPIVAREGDYADGVYLVRSGFARLSEKYNHGERTVSYLGRGQVFGFDEIAHNWRSGDQLPYQRTLRAIGYLDVLFVPTAVMERLVLPTLREGDLPPRIFKTADTPARFRTEALDKIGPEMLEFLVEKRFINGTAGMMIDLDRCTRCDDCVRACAAAHNNNPRFIRHGPSRDGFMIANACMHCLDPVCMIGCPTGAIHRASASGQVVINDLTCIGCSMCANSCPYDNIQMVVARNAGGVPYYDEATHQPIQKAAKCDLCIDQITGPACANACPHDALARVNMSDLDALSQWVNK